MFSLPLGVEPNVRTKDAEVWTKFLEDRPFDIEKVWYNLRVGKVYQVPKQDDPSMERFAQSTYRKKIDVVFSTPGRFYVAELKPFGSFTAIGQAMLYARLFVDEFDDPGLVFPTIICNNADPDALELYKEQNLTVWTV
jgi:hypothetical protein